jgi:hypothetical protein
MNSLPPNPPRGAHKVIRFTNSEIENNIEEVIKKIENEINGRIQSPPCLPAGRQGGFRGRKYRSYEQTG